MIDNIKTIYLEDKVFAVFNKYPKELQDSWVLITIFDEKNNLGGVCSLYINDQNPKGSILISNKINNMFPDAYITFDKDGSFNRIYTRPKYRNLGIMKNLGNVLKTIIYKKLNIYITTAKLHNPAGHEVMKSGISLSLGSNDKDDVVKSKYWKEPNSIEPLEDMEYRDPCSPSYWHDINYKND